MDKKEAKHLSEVLKAYSEDRVVQIRTSHGWEDIIDDRTKFCGAPGDYRIKPEPKIRPYKDINEYLWNEKIHGPRIHYPLNEKALVIPKEVFHWGVVWTTYSDSRSDWEQLSRCTWQDGTPCGINEN